MQLKFRINKAVYFFLLIPLFLSCEGNNENNGRKIYVDYYDDGGFRKIDNLDEDGVMNGYSYTFFPSGEIEWMASFKDDKQDGLALEYYENNQLVSEVMWADGKIKGHEIFFNKEGDTLRMGYKDDRVKRGKWYFWDDLGNKTCIDYDTVKVQVL